MKAFGEQGWAVGVEFEGIMSFNNASPAVFSGNPANKTPTSREPNLLIGTAVNPPANIRVVNNYLYHPLNTGVTNLRLGYIANQSKNLTVENNYVAGGAAIVSISGWENISFKNNTLVGQDLSNGLIGAWPTATHDWTLDQNLYFDSASNGSTARRYSFSWLDPTQTIRNAFGGGRLAFDEAPRYDAQGQMIGQGWRQWTGFDANSIYTPSLPTGVKVFVRPNQYESGRANVAIYNWDHANTVSVNLSGIGLTNGDQFEVRNVQNYFGPTVLTGTYNPASPTVNIPMTDLTVTPPIGQSFVPASTLPEFGVFLVKKNGNGADAVTAYDAALALAQGRGALDAALIAQQAVAL